MEKEKIILLIVGAFIGFLVSLAKDWLMEGKKQKEKEKQFKREKLEELFVLLNKWNKNVIKPLGSEDYTIEQEQLTMIVRFYFPDIKPMFDEYILESTKVISAKLKGEDYTKLIFEDLPKILNPLNQAIVNESQKF